MKSIIKFFGVLALSVLFCGIAVASPKKVLHVSTVEQNEVQAYVNGAGAQDLFEITQVSLLNFNAGIPERLKNYDVIVFGINDGYEIGDYGVERTPELKRYVQNGGGIVWAHDTMELNFDLGPNVEIPAGVDDVGADWISGSQVEVVKDHEVLHRPYQIAKLGDIFNIQDTHSTGGIVTTADLILSFYGNAAAPNNFYLTVNEWGAGRVVVNQFGHSAWPDNLPSVQEAQLFANSLYWASGCGDHFGRHKHDDRDKTRGCGEFDRDHEKDDRDHRGDDGDHEHHDK